jgi:hypothetical protein
MNIKLKRRVIYTIVLSFSVTIKASQWEQYDNAYTKNIRGTIDPDIIYNSMQLDEEDSISTIKIYNNKNSNELIFKAHNSKFMDQVGFKYYTEKFKEEREHISMGSALNYSDLKGITSFRGSNMRDNAAFGESIIKEEKLEILWKKDIGTIDSWTGVGWNGQPSIVQWDEQVINEMNIYEEKKKKNGLIEVIYGALDGYVHFLDLEDGKPTREKLNIGAPIKGSVTVDPRGYPILYVGQGINQNSSKFVDFAYRIFSLTNFKKLYEIKGADSFARRSWGAFDSTALIDKATDQLFICGENGVFYSGKLNTIYKNGTVAMEPKIDKYRYDATNKNKKGIENSIAIYMNYGYFADNDGLLQCIDLNTLKPVWAAYVNDDTDSTIALEREEKGLSLYTACEVDLQGNNGLSYVRKLDATSGKVLWEQSYKCAYVEEVNGGVLSSPIIGKKDISNLVIYNIARTPEPGSSLLIAFDKVSGEEVWRTKLKNYCWSSPIATYSTMGKSYIIQCDSTGKTFLIEGISGKILDTIDLEANVEGSPAAFNNINVVGTRGGRIIGFQVK